MIFGTTACEGKLLSSCEGNTFLCVTQPWLRKGKYERGTRHKRHKKKETLRATNDRLLDFLRLDKSKQYVRTNFLIRLL